jgi:hypothetical protein
MKLQFDANQQFQHDTVAAVTGNDQLKANAVQIFKAKGVTSFKTVWSP